jgi:Zn-dependent protease
VFGGGFRIARIGGPRGFDVRLDITWFLGALLVGGQIWSVFKDDTPRAVAFTALTVALFFTSIFVHELAHALTFRSQGIAVIDVTLWLMGGFTRPAEEPKTPMAAFLSSAAGPAASAAVGVALLLAGAALHPGVTHNLVRYYGRLNLWLALFNALPGFPLDGGHVLRAAVWRATHDRDLATIIAARVGQAVGILLIAAVVAPSLSFGLFSGNGLAVIGIFIAATATAIAQDAQRTRRLGRINARAAMSPPPPSIPADLAAGEAIGTYLQGHDGEAFPVVAGDHVLGFASLATARALTPDRPMREAVGWGQHVLQVGPEDRLDDVIGRLRQADVPVALVVQDGRVIGVIEPKDLTRALSPPARGGSTPA